MYIAVDTETIGLDGPAFMVLAHTDEDRRYCWEWKVNPLTHNVSVSSKAKKQITELIDSGICVFHNAPFDLYKLEPLIDSKEVMRKLVATCHDTMALAHYNDNTGPRGLKPLGDLICDILPTEKEELQELAISAKRQLKKLGYPTPGKPEEYYWAPRFIYDSDVCKRYGLADVKTGLLLFLTFKELYADEIARYEECSEERITMLSTLPWYQSPTVCE